MICADVRELETKFVFHWKCQVKPRCQAEPRVSSEDTCICLQLVHTKVVLGPLAARSEYLIHRLVVSDVQLWSAPCEGDAATRTQG